MYEFAVQACSNIWDLVLEKDVTSSAASAPGSLTNDHRQKLLRDIKKSSSLWRQFIKEHEETWPKGTVSKMLAPPQRLATYPTGCKNKPADQDMDVPAIDVSVMPLCTVCSLKCCSTSIACHHAHDSRTSTASSRSLCNQMESAISNATFYAAWCIAYYETYVVFAFLNLHTAM